MSHPIRSRARLGEGKRRDVKQQLLVRHLQVGAVVLGDEGAVALAQDRDLLLNVFDLVLRLLQVNDLYRHHLLGAIVDALEHLAERALANALQLGEQLLGIGLGVLYGTWSRETSAENKTTVSSRTRH